MNVLSIQSHVSYGHVGNSAAAFPLQRLGFEVWRVNTVQFSNHTGYDDWRGEVFSASQIADLLQGLEARGAFGQCDAILSGYIGNADLGNVIVDTVRRIKIANPGALYLCDPVMGDREPGLYVRDEIPAFMRDSAIPAADIITPNAFELETLTGLPVRNLNEAVVAARSLLKSGPRIVVVTSLRPENGNADEIGLLAVTSEGAWMVSTPFLALDPAPNGAGDTVAALLLAQLLRGKGPQDAISEAASAIYAVIEETGRRGERELQLIAAQDSIVNPPKRFEAHALV